MTSTKLKSVERVMRVVMSASLILAILFAGLPIHQVMAATCGGAGQPSCEDLNPNSTGCGNDATMSGTAKLLADAGTNLSFVETRRSNACNAKWTRAVNKSGGNRYAAASLRYGGANYDYSKNVSSPGTIPSATTVTAANTVYTPMHVPGGATPTRSCGAVLTSGPISVPLVLNNNTCTGQN